MAESSSVFSIYWKTRRHISTRPMNRWMPAALALLSFMFDRHFGPIGKADYIAFLNVLLCFDGAVLGFSIAGFGVSQFFSNTNLLVTLTTTSQSQDQPSHFKIYLLIWFHVLCGVGFASAMLALLYFMVGYSKQLLESMALS